MSRKTVPVPILIFIWLAIIGSLFWWWQGREEAKETGTPEILKESGPAALVETAPLKEKDTSSDERRIADLKQIKAAYEMYYDEHGKYPDWPEDDLVPNYFPSKYVFQDIYWLGYGEQQFCIWIKLNEKDSYYVISDCGEKEIAKEPAGSFDYCCELSKE